MEGVKTICDLGCGNGYLTTRFASLGYDMTGVDLSRSGLEIERNTNGSTRYLEASIDSSLGSHLGVNFDMVLSSDVIETLYCAAELLGVARVGLRLVRRFS